MNYPGGMSSRAVTMDAFAAMMSFNVGRPIINETGLPGEFDLDMSYAPDLGSAHR